MSQGAPRQRYSSAEYLAVERAASEKHALWDGELFAMAGASRTHNLIVAAVLGELRNRLLGGPCAPYASEQRIHLPDRDRYVYPDVSVVCAPVETDPLDDDTIQNPTLILEVLSDSTEAFDRGNEFVGYRQIASLQDYLLVSQREIRIEHYARQVDGSWALRMYETGARVPIASLRIELEVDAIYMGIELTPP